MAQYDLIIIGGGPAGYAAAFEAAANGLKTCIAEKREVGGTCLNRGCIPTKTLVHTADEYREMKAGGIAGIEADGVRLNASVLNARKDEVVSQLRDGLAKQIKAAKADLITGEAKVIDAHTVSIGDDTYTAENILVASGSEPAVPPIEGADLPVVITSDGILKDLPQYASMVIIGGGVIGCEMAGIYESFGTTVTVIEAMDTLLPTLDAEAGRSLALLFKKRGIDVHCKSMVSRISQTETGASVTYTEKGTEKTVGADIVLMSVGRRANTAVFACEPPVMERGRIVTDASFETSIKGIYAAGDIVYGYPQLAHTAMAMGINAVCAVCGIPAKKNMDIIPSGVYTSPEIASVGYSEKEAAEKGFKAVSGKANTMANARSLIAGGERGFVKVTADQQTGRILGVLMYCHRATDLIQEAAAAIAAQMTVKDLLAVIHGHPTFAEVFENALEAAEKKLG